MSFLHRWWPLPAVIAVAAIAQQVTYSGRYDVGGHAAEHLGGGAFVYLATVVAVVLLWLTPAARRSPIVLVGLAAWLAAGVAIAIGNVQVVDALIQSGQATTPSDLLRDTDAVSGAHDLANTAPLPAVAAAMLVTFGLYRVRAASSRLASIAAVLNVLIPYWIIPGFGLVVITIAQCMRRERSVRGTPPAVIATLFT